MAPASSGFIRPRGSAESRPRCARCGKRKQRPRSGEVPADRFGRGRRCLRQSPRHCAYARLIRRPGAHDQGTATRCYNSDWKCPVWLAMVILAWQPLSVSAGILAAPMLSLRIPWQSRCQGFRRTDPGRTSEGLIVSPYISFFLSFPWLPRLTRSAVRL